MRSFPLLGLLSRCCHGFPLYFGGGATPPPAPIAPIAPPAAETPTNTPQANLLKKQGLQSTLLTGGGTKAQAGSLLGGSSSPLGASSNMGTMGALPNAYGGES
jgi:hypothetical protein